MNVLGKCAPAHDALQAAADRGFEAVELYLTVDDLVAVDETANTVERASVDAEVVHTPHVQPEDERSFRLADELADLLDAYLIVHSQYLQHTHIPTLEAYEFDVAYGYENNPGASVFHLKNLVLEQGHDLVLDTAHLYTAERSYLDALERLLRRFGEQIQVVHLTDGTLTTDGLAFGRGEIDLDATTQLIDNHHDGMTVLEVMPEDQRDARESVIEWLT